MYNPALMRLKNDIWKYLRIRMNEKPASETKSKPSDPVQVNGQNKLTKERIANAFVFTKEELEETRCGLGSCQPDWIQRLATKEIYMLVYCLIGVVQGMFFTYSVSVISTIEKRFKLTSKQTGVLLSGNDISQIILSIFLGYYGNFGHRPRWLGVGALFSAASCLIAGVPHLIYGPGKDAIEVARAATFHGSQSNYSAAPSKEELCHIQPDLCEDFGGESPVALLILLFIAQFFVGISISIFVSLGVSFLDDNINKKSYPIYYTMTLLLRVIGPVLGFVVGGKCLSMWIDPSQAPNISKKDPRWLGAWWVGFFFIGSGMALTGFLLFFFPRKLPATLRRERKRMVKQAEKDEKEGENRGIEYFIALSKEKKIESKPTFKNLLKALKRLFTNEIWVGNLFNSVVAILALSGYWNFSPKYLENQFRKSASEANYYTGMASLVVSVIGALLSGIILRWVRPGPKFVTGYAIFITFSTAIGFFVLMFVGCPKLEVIGPVDGSVLPDCSKDCGCTNRYSPVCSEDDTSLFYSPCYAGCTAVNITTDPIVYSDCKCIASNSSSASIANLLYTNSSQVSGPWGFATRGYCPEPCTAFTNYLVVQIVVKTIGAAGHISNSLVHLRSVSDEDKGLALGTLTVFISLFGFIPAPIIMGAIIDSACVIWDETCGVSGNCWLYDSDKFRFIIHLVPGILMLVSVLGDFVIYHYSGRLDLYGLKEVDIELSKTIGKKEEKKEPVYGSKPSNETPNDETEPLNPGPESKASV